MKLKDQTIKELEHLGPSEIIKVYDMVIALKSVQVKPVKKSGLSMEPEIPTYRRVT